MADNTTLNAGSGGDVIASDDVGGVKYQVVKLDVGADGVAAPVSNSNPVPISDAGGAITVDGTVGVSGSVAVTNAGITTIAGAVSGTEMQVDIVSAPTLTVNSHAVTNAGTFAVQATQSGTWAVTGAAAEDAAASGNPVLVGGRYDSSARTLETGDAGAIALNASGQVLVEIAAGAGSGGTAMADGATFTRNTTSLTPAGAVVETSAPTLTNGGIAGLSQTTGGALRVDVASGGIAGVVEDAAASGGEEGILMLGVRRDSASSGVSADGDFTALSLTSDGSLRVSGSSGTTQYAEDAAHTTGDQLVAMGAVRRDSAAVGSGTDGDYSTINVDASGRLWSIAAQSGTWTVDLGATDNAVLDAIAASLATLDNVVAGNEAQVDVLTLPNVTLAAGTNTNEVVGDAADDAAAAGNPLSVGGYSIQTDGTDPGVVSAEGDAARLRTDMQRILLVNETHPRLFRASADYASAQTNATVQAAPGAGLSLYITDVIISNGATAGNITLLDGSGGTVLLEIYPAINGGMTHSFRNPLRLTANTLLAITSTTVTTHSVTVTGYIAP